MHPVLVRIPFVHLTIWSFGAMAVLGFLAALFLTRRMCRRAGLDPEVLSNVAIFCLIIGMLGARAFFVIHYFPEFRQDPLSVFAVWRGGLEFVGGAIPAIVFLVFYLRRHKLPVRRYLDILAVGLMLGLAFGRIGCFLNGCCYGKPTDLPWGVRFPYRSYAYISQINADPDRGRTEPRLDLPRARYFDFETEDGKWYPKPLSELTDRQRHAVTEGKHRCLAVHPTQLYACANALLLSGILYACWRRSSNPSCLGGLRARFWRPGLAFSLAFILYGVTRSILEAIRDDNPYEFGSLTISQITGALLVAVGVVLLTAHVLKPLEAPAPDERRKKTPRADAAATS